MGRCASVDGDADRLLYFSSSADGLLLLDGDRIAALSAILVQKLLEQLPTSAGNFTVRHGPVMLWGSKVGKKALNMPVHDGL